MKCSLKSIVLVTGFMVLSNGLHAAAAAPDPDLSVYNAITKGLGFVPGSKTLPATIMGLTNPSDPIFTSYVTMLTNALAFYTSDGKTVPTTTPLSTYYNDVNLWLGAVNAQQATLVADASSFSAAVKAIPAASTSGTANIDYINTSILRVFTSTIGLNSSDVKTLCNTIIAAASPTVIMGQTNLSAYLTSLSTVLTAAISNQIFTLVTGASAALTAANTLISPLTAAVITQITTAIPTAPGDIATLLGNSTFTPAVRAWRTFKTATPVIQLS